jgi:hypothetical protein
MILFCNAAVKRGGRTEETTEKYLENEQNICTSVI